jgi:hypothetical protein
MRRLPLADSAALRRPARRTRVLGIALGTILVLLVLLFAAATRARAVGDDVLPPGANAIVVLDLSASTRSYAGPISNTLLALTKDGRRHLGLIVFSDSAYLALPPSTPVEGLRGWLDLFQLHREETYPWSNFSGGTAISSGLTRAYEVIKQDHVAHPHVILVSDLIDDNSDVGRLASIVAQYRQDQIDLRIVSVKGTTEGESALAAAQEKTGAFVEKAASANVDPTKTSSGHVGLVGLLVFVLLLGIAAAVFELVFHPLAWRSA